MNLTSRQIQRLNAAPVGRLATAALDAAPHIIPVCFALANPAAGARIYSVLDQKPKRAPLTRLRRVRNILANPQAALLIDHYNADWRQLWYLLLSGPAQLLTDPADPERQTALRRLQQKYPQYRTMNITANPVIKLTVEQAISWDAAP